MHALRRTFLAALALLPALALAGKPIGGTTTAFGGLTTSRAKIADPVTQNALYGGGQHSMQVAGTQLVAAFPDFAGQSVWIARSLDGGATWLPSQLAVRAQPVIRGVGSPLAIGPDPAAAGRYRVHVVFDGADAAGASVVLHAYATLDPALGAAGLGGFSQPVPVGSTGGGGEIAIAADARGGVHVVSTAGGGVVYGRSADYGTSFVETNTLVTQYGAVPAIAATATGDVFVAFGDSAGAYVARRTFGAPAFDSPVLAAAANGELSLAAADSSRLYLSFVGGGTFHVARSVDGGQHWTTSDGPRLMCGTAPCGGLYGSSVAVSATGAVGVATADYGPDLGFYARSTDGGASWGAATTIAGVSWGTTLTFDAAGKANLAFVHTPEGETASAAYFTKEK